MSSEERKATVDLIRDMHRHAPLLFELVEAAAIHNTVTEPEAFDKYGSPENYRRVVQDAVDRLDRAQRAIREGAD